MGGRPTSRASFLIKSFKRKASDQGPGSGNPWTSFERQKRSNESDESTTDARAKLIRKRSGPEGQRYFGGYAATENHYRLCVRFEVRSSVEDPESEVAVNQALELNNRGFRSKSIRAEKGCHCAGFVKDVREQGIPPHPALGDNRDRMGIRRSPAYSVSRRICKRIEDIFGWVKTAGGFRKSRYRGIDAGKPPANMRSSL